MDMEDLGAGGRGMKGAHVLARVQRTGGAAAATDPHAAAAAAAAGGEGGNAGAAAAAEPAAPPAPKPDIKEDYAGWVAHQKGAWRAARQEKKRRKLEAAAAAKRGGGGDAGGAGPGARGADVGRILRQQAAALTALPWQVVQLAETAAPGVLKVRGGEVTVRHVFVCRGVVSCGGGCGVQPWALS